MKAKEEMAEKHLINESHVYVGEGEIPEPYAITHACVHTPICVQPLLMGAKQFMCWGQPGGSEGGLWEVCAALQAEVI